MHDQPINDAPVYNEADGGRCCQNCAVAYLVQPPAVPTAAQLKANPALANAKPVLICRLNPPVLMPGNQLLQLPTQPHMVCWHWRHLGTLPGDDAPADVH